MSESSGVRPLDPRGWLARLGDVPIERESLEWLRMDHSTPKPPKGLDLLGERVTGWWARREARKLSWARVESIVARGTKLAHGSTHLLEEAAREAGELARLRRDEETTVDAVFVAGYAAVKRALGLSLHPVQVRAALAMAHGACAELATGEGKTVTAILPAALNGFAGRGVHVITVNDYLARRDVETTREAYRLLGLSCAVVTDATERPERRAAYRASITYLADKQAIFDYLRDRLIAPVRARVSGALLEEVAARDGGQHWADKLVQRGLAAAIVDEADSVLIDDAITPAIISVPAGSEEAAESSWSQLRVASGLVGRFAAGEDFIADDRQRRVALTPKGRGKLAELAPSLPPLWTGPRRREELMVLALTATHLYERGRDYLVRDGKAMIVDRSTGRVLPGRQWQLGLHQAIEAKEELAFSREARTAARSSYQSFFRRYRQLSGMTGTAWEVRHELWTWYRLPVVRIPTHAPVIRRHHTDRVFSTREEKLAGLVNVVREASARGQPVLVGTWSIAASERVAAALAAGGVECGVINAVREAEEAAIIERAGEPGRVTVATNMAGRGTDIRLSPKAKEAGGLLVIATERHDEPRVDRQLFGRAGRQGDPGEALALVSLEDELVKRHGLPPLVALARGGGVLGARASRVLWSLAQWAASRRWATLRAEAAKAEHWFDMAMHTQSR